MTNIHIQIAKGKSFKLDNIDKDENGNTILHTAIIYNNTGAIKKIMKEYPELINFTNLNKKTPLFYLLDNLKFFDSIISKYKSIIMFDLKENIKVFSELIKRDDLPRFKKIFPLTQDDGYLLDCVELSTNFNFLKYIVRNIKDINIGQKYFTNLLFQCVIKNKFDFFKFLIKKGININYCGRSNMHNHMIELLYLYIENEDNKKYLELIKLLIDKNMDMNIQDKNLISAGYVAAFYGNKLPKNVFREIIRRSDINLPTTNKETILKILIKNNLVDEVKDILENKPMDIYYTDMMKELKQEEKKKIIKLASKSYKKESKSKKSIDELSEEIENTKTSIIEEEYKIDYLGTKHQNGFTYKGTLYNVVLFSLYLLEQFENIGFVYNKEHKDRQQTELYLYKLNFNQKCPIKCEKLDMLKSFYTLVPSFISWLNKDNYVIDENIIDKIDDFKIRFLVFPITIYYHNGGAHANILLLDKQKRTVERFDPQTALDNDLDDVLNEYFREYEYIRPSSFLNSANIQDISKDNDYKNKKYSDPNGFCLIWCIWYIELRMKNPDADPKKLVQGVLKNMIKKASTDRYTEKIIIDYIRGYGAKIVNKTIKNLRSMKVSEHSLNDNVLIGKDLKKLEEGVQKHFMKLIAGRIN